MDSDRVATTRWISGVNLLLGVWLVVAPFVMGLTSTSSYWNEIVVGVIILALALYRMSAVSATWTGWVTLVAGLWLIASPYMFSPGESAAYTNAVIAGIVAVVLGLGAAAVPATSDVTAQHPM